MTTPTLNDNLVPRLMDYGLTLDEHVVICDRRVVDEAAAALVAQSKEIEALRAALAQAEFWLDGALNCKDWRWDADQHEAASDSLDTIRTALKGA